MKSLRFFNLPVFLIISRGITGILLVVLSYFYGKEAKNVLIFLLSYGFISDIFDGIIARKLKISTITIRRLDSQIDVIFWLGAGISVWIISPDLVLNNLYSIVFLIFMEILCYMVSIIKFGKETCTHALISKLWGISLFIVFISLLGFQNDGILFKICVILGFISHLDVILITLLLPKWENDIPSFIHALKIRKGKTIKRCDLFNG